MGQLVLEESHDIFWAQLCWSLQWLELGRHPTHGPPPLNERYTTGIERGLAGTLLAGGFYCVLWLLRADLDHFAKVMKLENYGSSFPCFACCANEIAGGLPWTDFRLGAKYLATIWTNVAWKLARPNRHRLFRLAGVGVEQAQPDTMHTKHGGVDAYFYASVLKYIVNFIMVGTPENNVKAVWKLINKEFQRSNPTNQFTGLTLGMFCRGDMQFPLLKGRASQTKHLGATLFCCLEK